MTLTSVPFLLFAALLFLVYYTVPGRVQWVVLLVASYGFYLSNGLHLLGFIAFTTLTVYGSARYMAGLYRQQDDYLSRHKGELSREQRKTCKQCVKRRCRKVLAVCLGLNFLLLALCKFLLVEPFRSAAAGTGLSFLTVALPLGISFYLFQATGYLVDVYRRTVEPEHSLFRFALFVSFFPQLIQGPISKFSVLQPQLFAPHKFNRRMLQFGLQRMLWGYFKKLVLADRMAVAVAALRGTDCTGVGFFLLSLFYAVQIYCDFTGGMDLVIGLGECLGMKLPENFVRPYFSKNTAEYWRRWHITLGEWMKDYIFYPVSVSQPMLRLAKYTRSRFGHLGKRLPVYLASVLTWSVTGLWHGVTPNFLLWGLMNCLVIVVSQELEPVYARVHGKFHLNDKPWYDGFQILRMFLLMNLIRVCDLFPHVGDYFRGLWTMFTLQNLRVLWDGTLLSLGLTGLDYIVLSLGILLVFSVSLWQEKHGSVREYLCRQPRFFRYALWYGLFLAVLLMGRYGVGYEPSNFIYSQF